MSTFSISDVSKKVCLSPKTIRYYESIGVIKSLERSHNTYRQFTARDIERLIMVRRARALGLSLSDIKNLVSECIDKGCGEARGYVADRIPKYLHEVDQQIVELEQLRSQLQYMKEQYGANPKQWQHKTETCCQIIPIKEDVK